MGFNISQNDPYFINLMKFYKNLPGSLSWKDKNGVYIWNNHEFLNDLSINKSILGKNDAELWPEEYLSIAENDKKVLSTDSTHTFEEALSVKNKKQHFITIKSPLKDANNQTVGIIVNLIPLSKVENYHSFSAEEIKNLEKNSKLSDHYLRNIIESVPGSIYWKNRDGVWIGCNNYTLKTTGISSPEDLLGKTDDELWPEYAKELRENDLRVMNTGCTLSREESVILPNGKKKYFAAEKMPLRDLDGNIIGIIGNSIDITELKETQENLAKAKIAAEAGEKAKSEFIANVSHDMRTPLSGLIGLAHWLEDDVTEAERKDLSAQLAEAGDSLLEMFEEILEDVAAEHMTENSIKLETFDLNRLVDRLAKLKKPSLTQKGLEFVVHIDPNIPSFLVSDRRKIHRMVLNLMGNAIKFTKQGHIELKIELLKKENDHVTLKFNVIDTGIGVPEDSKARLFERFYKASPSYKAEYKGFGLGLHIAKSYAHLLGGTLSFESTEGVGSDFYAIIPLKIASPEEIKLYKETSSNKPSLLKINTNIKPKPLNEKPIAPIKSTDPQPQLNAPAILVIEDNLVIRRSTVRLVKKFGVNVIDVEDGKPALELAKTQHFDLILADVGLIEMSGIEFTQQLRAFEKQNNIAPVPIVGVTAHAVDGRNECLNAGMNAVIPKPLSPELLAEILQNFLPDCKFNIAKKS